MLAPYTGWSTTDVVVTSTHENKDVDPAAANSCIAFVRFSDTFYNPALN